MRFPPQETLFCFRLIFWTQVWHINRTAPVPGTLHPKLYCQARWFRQFQFVWNNLFQQMFEMFSFEQLAWISHLTNSWILLESVWKAKSTVLYVAAYTISWQHNTVLIYLKISPTVYSVCKDWFPNKGARSYCQLHFKIPYTVVWINSEIVALPRNDYD